MSRRTRWGRLGATVPLLGLLACGLAACRSPTPADMIAPATPAAAQSALPVEVDASRMVTRVRPRHRAPCAGFDYPIDGRAAFDAAVRAAIGPSAGGAVQKVTVVGRRLVFNYGAGPEMLGQVALTPSATITTRLHVHTPSGRSEMTLQSNGTGYRSFNGYVGCDALGEALADAYRAALRDLSAQIADRLWLVGWSTAGLPVRF